MSFRLIPPGKRHGNKHYYAVISQPGVRREISTYTADKKMAGQFAAKADRELYESHMLGRTSETVEAAIERYIMFRQPRPQDQNWLLDISAIIGHKEVSEIKQGDFDDCAIILFPDGSPQTRNRQVYTPLQAALKHSGINLTIKRPKQPKPRHRSLTAIERDVLIKNAEDQDLKALLCLMFFTGCRISEAISLTWDRVDLSKKSALFEMTKTDTESWVPLHPRIVTALANLTEKKGRVLRWQTKSGPRKPIAKLCKAVGIKFNPHMARHTFGDLMMENGASLRDLMEAGRWSDAKSAMRYTGRKQERLRKRIGKL